jgi:hypothetical protein
MVTRKSIRSAQSGGGAGGYPSRTHPTRRAAGSAAVGATLQGNRVSTEDEMMRKIIWLCLRLEVIHRTAMTTHLALQLHGFGHDLDIAECLRAGVCDPLARQVKLTQSILEHLGTALPVHLLPARPRQ